MIEPGPTHSVSELVYRTGCPDADDPAETFTESTKLYPSTVRRQALPKEIIEFVPYYRDATPRATKAYSACRAIPLPEARIPDVPLSTVLRSRRTRYAAKGMPVPLLDLATLLFAGYGITGEVPDTRIKLRTSPSGGALYPLDLYWVNHAVTGLAPGVYHYNPFRHSLEVLAEGDMMPGIERCLIQPEMVSEKFGHLVIAASFWRSRFKYGPRGCRFPWIETGHVAQNVLLAAEALKIMAACLGGYYDARVDDLIGLDGVNESTVYVMALSKLRE